MNEATGFCSGECPGWTPPNNVMEKAMQTPEFNEMIYTQLVEETGKFLQDYSDDNETWYQSYYQNFTSTYYLPFIAGFQPIDDMVMSLNATHPESKETEYNLHNLYGHMMAQRVYNYFTDKSDELPFILTRSTFASSGQYAAHWLGDNFRNYSYMNYSIAGIMNMNMFGIPMAGADVGGFFGDFDPELTAKWIQLSQFYPFARTHSNLTVLQEDGTNTPMNPGEPYKLEGLNLKRGIESIYQRYSYIK